MADTRLKDIHDKLTEKGISVYFPGQKTGECTQEYVVIKEAGKVGLTEVSTSQVLYDIMCYVPLSLYSTLDGLLERVESAMDELFPMFRPVHYRTPSFTDDEVKAHIVSTQYVNYVKNKRR